MPSIPPTNSGLAPIPLDQDAQEVLDAVLTLAEALHLAAPEAATIYDVPVDLHTLEIPTLADAAALMQQGAERLAAIVTGADAGAVPALGSLRRQLHEVAAAVNMQNTELAADDPEDAAEAQSAAAVLALGDVEFAIREHAFERDYEVLLASTEEGLPAVFGARIPPETAHVWLLERLMQRLERASYMTQLATLERAAARWWFARWSATARGSLLDGETFSQEVREQEWSLTERPTVEDNIPLLYRVLDSPTGRTLPPYQQTLARALRRARAGVFHVRQIRGDTVTVEEAGSHTRLEMHEHRTPVNYEVGFVLLGRLIPLPSGRWLRSPGALVVAPPDPWQADRYVSAFARSIEEMTPALSRGIALEAMISTTIGLAPVPGDIPPTPSPEAARLLGAQVLETLLDAGLCETTPEEEVPPELMARLHATDAPKTEAFRMQVDELLSAWIMALNEQGAVKSALPHSRGDGRHKKKRRRKRR